MINSNMFLDKIQESFQWLIDLGYEFKQIETNILFELIREDEAFSIGFSWADYNQILVNGIVAYKRFNIVEDVLQEVTKGDLDYTIKRPWVGVIPEELESVNDQKQFKDAFFLDNLSEVDMFSALVKGFYDVDAKSFFNKYDCLETIVKEMDVLSRDKKASMIVNTSNSTFLRIMAIKYYVNPIEAEEFYMETVKELSPLKSQKTFDDILKNLGSLKSKLPHSHKPV